MRPPSRMQVRGAPSLDPRFIDPPGQQGPGMSPSQALPKEKSTMPKWLKTPASKKNRGMHAMPRSAAPRRSEEPWRQGAGGKERKGRGAASRGGNAGLTETLNCETDRKPTHATNTIGEKGSTTCATQSTAASRRTTCAARLGQHNMCLHDMCTWSGDLDLPGSTVPPARPRSAASRAVWPMT